MNGKKTETEKGKKTRSRIAKNAIKLINEQGYDQTKVQDICKATDIGVGTFYHYYRSKEDILVNYIREESKEIMDFYRSLKDYSSIEKLRQVLYFQLDYYYIKGKEIIKRIIEAELHNGSYQLTNYSIAEIIYDCVQAGREKGEFTQLFTVRELQDLVLFYWTGLLFHWLQSAERIENKEVFSQKIEEIVKFVSRR